MNKKIDNLKELQYYGDFNLVADVITRLKKKHPDNTKIIEAVDAMTQIGFFVQNLISDRYFYNESMNQYRADKIRAIERARKADKLVEELKKELVVYKKKKELGL